MKISKWIFRLWNGRLLKPYELNANVEWKALKGESRISISGRAVGGCLDLILAQDKRWRRT